MAGMDANTLFSQALQLGTRSGEQQQRRAQLMAAYPAVGHAVALHEYLQDVSASGESTQLKGWLAWADHSRLTYFHDLAGTLKRHRDGVRSYMETKPTNGLMAAVKGLLQLAKRIARRLRIFHYFRLAAYLKAGGLNPQTPQLLPT
jgi:transposase